MNRFMKSLRTFLTRHTLRTLALGTFCAVGAFAVGIETAGDVHPFAKSEAAIQEVVNGFGHVQGDADGNGAMDANDAYIVFHAIEELNTPSEDETFRGDMDGDGRLTSDDLNSILRLLSLQ